MYDLPSSPKETSTKKVFVAICLIFIQFLGVFDASSIDGIVPLLQKHFNINDSQSAIIRTYGLFLHTFGLVIAWIIGDLFERQKLFFTSVILWISVNLLGILLGTNTYWVFVAFRCIGSAIFSVFGVLIPVMLADLFKEKALGVAMMSVAACDILSANVIGIISSWVVSANLPWQTGLLIGPLIALAPLLVVFNTRSLFQKVERPSQTRSLSRIFLHAFGIFTNKSFVLLTIIISFGYFFVMAGLFWLPSFVLAAWTYQPDAFMGLSYTPVTTINTFVQMAGMLSGMPLSLWFAQSWHHGTGPFSGTSGYNRAYAIVLSLGLLLNPSAFMLGLLLILKNYLAFLAVVFFCGVGSATVSLSQLMILMVVPSSSRAAAVALSRLISGIISSPSSQFVGMISDAIRGDSALPFDRFRSYQIALLIAASFVLISVISSVFLVVVFPGDCEQAKREDEETVNEKTSLIGTTEGKRESILDR